MKGIKQESLKSWLMTYSNTQTQPLPDSQHVMDSWEKAVPPILVLRHARLFPSHLLHLIIHSYDLNTCLFLPLFQKWVPSDENGQPFPITGVIFLNCTYWKLIFLFWQLLIFQMWASTSPASELLMEPGCSSLKHASGEPQHMTSSVFLGWLTDKALSWTEADH